MHRHRFQIIASLLLLAPSAFAQAPAPAPVPPAPAPPGTAPAPVLSAAPPAAAAPEAAAPEAAPAPAAALGAAPPRAAAPEAAPPPAGTPEGAPPPAGTPEEEKPAHPTKLEVGKNGGFWEPSALLQTWALMTRKEGETDTTFRIRRAELRVKGEIVPELVGYTVMIDPAKVLAFEERTIEVEHEGEVEDPGEVSVQQPGDDRSILQDLSITFISEYADVSIGQFKIPVSLEGYGSSSKLLFPERSRVSRAFGDRRDIGLRVEKKIGEHFFYYAGIFNGSGLNQLDQDDDKDVTLRVEVYPVEGLTIGAVGYATVGERDEDVRDRLEGDIRYEGNGLLVQAEYIHGWDGAGDARVESHGAYGALGYTFIDRIQPIARVGFVNELEAADDQTTFYEGGVNYYLRGQEARLALTVSAFDFEERPTEVQGILFAQVRF